MSGFDLVQSRAEANAFLKQSRHEGQDVFLSTRQVADRFGWQSIDAVRMWAKRSKLAPYYVGRTLRFSALEIRAEIERQTRIRRKGRV